MLSNKLFETINLNNFFKNTFTDIKRHLALSSYLCNAMNGLISLK